MEGIGDLVSQWPGSEPDAGRVKVKPSAFFQARRAYACRQPLRAGLCPDSPCGPPPVCAGLAPSAPETGAAPALGPTCA